MAGCELDRGTPGPLRGRGHAHDRPRRVRHRQPHPPRRDRRLLRARRAPAAARWWPSTCCRGDRAARGLGRRKASARSGPRCAAPALGRSRPLLARRSGAASSAPRDRFLLRSDSFLRAPRIEVAQRRAKTLWRGRLPRLIPGRSAHIPRIGLRRVDPHGGPVIDVRVPRHEREARAGYRRGDDRRQGGAVRRAACSRSPRRGATRSTGTPRRAGSSRTARRCSRSSPRRSPSCSKDPPGEVVACGLDHQGESMLAWDAESGKPLSPDRGLAGQALAARSSTRSPSKEEEVQKLSGLPFDPYFSAAKMAWLLRERRRRQEGSGRGQPADGHGGLLPLRPARRRLRHRCLDRVADPAADESTSRASIPELCEIFGVPVEVLPEVRDTAGDLGTLKHESWPVELPLRGQVPDQQAALAGAACVVPGRVKATYGTGVFVLAHVGEGVPEAGRRACCRPSRGASTARSSTRSTAGSSRPGRCSSGSARRWAWPRTHRRSEQARVRWPTSRPAPGCFPGSPASAPPGGGPTPAP